MWQFGGLILFLTCQLRFKPEFPIETLKRESTFSKPVIHVRFVSKGTNRQLAIESLVDMQEVLQDQTLQTAAEWKLELVTDNYIDLTDLNTNVNQIVVPIN